MSRFLLPILCICCMTFVIGLMFHETKTTAEPIPPAIAERLISAEDSLNPFVDLVRAKRENEVSRVGIAHQNP